MALIKKNHVFNQSSQTQVPTEIDEIRKYAEEQSINLIPFDIESLVKAFNIEIVFEDLEMDQSGYISKRGDRYVIGLNQYMSPRRQRFTLAHELAHYILHKNLYNDERYPEFNLFRDENNNMQEVEANNFASEILMPTKEYKKIVNDGIRLLTDIADYFDVSIAAARYKAFKLGYIKQY